MLTVNIQYNISLRTPTTHFQSVQFGHQDVQAAAKFQSVELNISRMMDWDEVQGNSPAVGNISVHRCEETVVPSISHYAVEQWPEGDDVTMKAEQWRRFSTSFVCRQHHSKLARSEPDMDPEIRYYCS